MKNAFIFHGTAGYPEENWFPWLKAELDTLGFSSLVPQFPTPGNQSLANWLRVMEPHMPLINEDTILIGHSLGGIFCLRILEQLLVPVHAAILVGTPIGVGEVKNRDSDALFLQSPLDWTKIRAHAKNFIVYHSDNDPYVSLDNGTALANHLGVNLSFRPSAGHFNKAAGYTAFPDLLADIRALSAVPQ